MLLAIQRLKDYQAKKGLNGRQMADLIGTSQPFYSYLMTGKRKRVSDELKERIQEETKRFVKISDWFKEADND